VKTFLLFQRNWQLHGAWMQAPLARIKANDYDQALDVASKASPQDSGIFKVVPIDAFEAFLSKYPTIGVEGE